MKKKLDNPKVFISYAWSTKEYDERVINFASRLRQDGIDVLLDKWMIDPGADTVNFMEKCVKDPTVTYVIMLLDKKYTEKADSRKGGVGIETQIISNEVYNNVEQSKFIPIIFDRGENGEVYVPVYLKTRFYYDMTKDNVEEEYMNLVKHIYGVEVYKKPELGQKPSWVDNESQKVDPLKFKIINSNNTINILSDLFNEIKNFKIEDNISDDEQILAKYNNMTIYRDCLLEFFVRNNENDFFLDEILDFYDELKKWNKENNSLKLEIWQSFIHETFIYLVAVLFRHKKYAMINTLITKSYFENKKVIPSCEYFYCYEYLNLEKSKKNIDNKNYLSPIAQLWIENIYESKVSKNDFIFADLLIYNLSILLLDVSWDWFPVTYIYSGGIYHNSCLADFSVKLKSKYELNRYNELFGNKDIEALKKVFRKMEDICKNRQNRYRYQNSFDCAELITDFVKVDEIGSVN